MRKFLLLFAAVAASAAAGQFFPLQVGNEWTYRDARSGQTITVRVATPIMHDDQVYYALLGYGAERLFVRQDDKGNLVAFDPETMRESGLTQFSATDGLWWNAPHRICEQDGQTQERRSEYRGPAGTIPESLTIRYRSYGCADVGAQEEIFAENIGMLRRIESSIAGPRTFDLVSARVGRLTIQADQHGRFTVSVQDVPAARELQIRLELNVDPSGEIRLQFPTSQQYDAQIRDSAGRLIWQWSDGQAFLQSLSDRAVYGRWVIHLTAPRPQIEWPQNNRFTITGWLPTLGGPQYAASTPFQITEPEQ